MIQATGSNVGKSTIFPEMARDAPPKTAYARDIANMGFACAAGVPVILVADIDRGSVIARIVGSKVVMSGEDTAQIMAFVVNKFRRDVRLGDDDLRDIELRSVWHTLRVLLGTRPHISCRPRAPSTFPLHRVKS